MTMPFTIILPQQIDDTNFVSSTLFEDDEPIYDPGTSYMIGERVMVTTGYHEIYQASTNNTGKFPPTSPDDWKLVGPTNVYAAFDESGGTATQAGTTYTFEVRGDLINSIAMLELVGTDVRIEGRDTLNNTFYDKTYTLEDSSNVLNWYDYFFSAILRKTELIVFDIPPVPEAIFRVTISSTVPVSVGTFVMGRRTEFGLTKYGATASIQTYGRVTTNEFGRRTRVRRGYAKRMSVTMEIPKQTSDFIYRLLAELRETPVLWVGAPDQYTMLTIYGDYKDFSFNIAYPTKTLLGLEVEGVA